MEVDVELTIRMNGNNDDAALVPRGSENVVGWVFVPCTVDQYVDFSKVSGDFKVIETAVDLRPEGGSGRTVQCAVDVRYAFVFGQTSPLVPAKPSTRRTRDKGVNGPMIRVLPVGLSSESRTSALK